MLDQLYEIKFIQKHKLRKTQMRGNDMMKLIQLFNSMFQDPIILSIEVLYDNV